MIIQNSIFQSVICVINNCQEIFHVQYRLDLVKKQMFNNYLFLEDFHYYIWIGVKYICNNS